MRSATHQRWRTVGQGRPMYRARETRPTRGKRRRRGRSEPIDPRQRVLPGQVGTKTAVGTIASNGRVCFACPNVGAERMNLKLSGQPNENQNGSPDNGKCRSLDWYSQGQSRTVHVAGVLMTVRLIGRKGRRSRIAIEAPAGAVFQ
jgi:hypothetical protein